MTVFALIAKNLVRGRVGRSWMAIRDMDIAAEIIGIPMLRTKLLAFAVSSFYCGVAGALFALLGVVNLWTAVDLTGVFVAGAALVQTVQFAVAGWFLTRYRMSDSEGGLTWRAIVLAASLAFAGLIAQNLIGG